jgi:hypothetical protein
MQNNKSIGFVTSANPVCFRIEDKQQQYACEMRLVSSLACPAFDVQSKYSMNVNSSKGKSATTDFLREGLLKTSYERVECDELGIALLSGMEISVGSIKDIMSEQL